MIEPSQAPGAPPWPGAAPPADDVPWRRLDPRMLLVHPVREVMRFFPVLIGVVVLGSTGGQNWWQLFGIGIPVALGVLRFLTTRFRITGTQIELQRGLLGRKAMVARLDRVRAVELTSSPIHRLLGLAKVEIGTASAATQGDDQFALDGLPLAEARDLRMALLHRSPETNRQTDDGSKTVTAESRGHDGSGAGSARGQVPGAVDGSAPAAPTAYADEALLHFDPAWARYAPLTTSGSVIAAGVLAVLGQFGERFVPDSVDEDQARRLVDHLSLPVVIPLVLLGFLLLGAVFSVLGYVVANWGFTLSRDHRGRSFHVRRGLLTNTETSLELERVRGLSVDEPIGLRLVGAARLAAIVTGVSRSDAGTTPLVPPAPRSVIDETGARVIEDSEPLHLTLVQHGPAARRRRWTRALLGAAGVVALAVLLAVVTPLPWWLVLPTLLAVPVAALLAADRYRRLGHGLTEEHLVVRSGSLRGRRDVIQRSGIIGWNVQQSWFQRRAGLATLVATTAAGHQAYAAIDVPETTAIALAHEAVPGLVHPFLA